MLAELSSFARTVEDAVQGGDDARRVEMLRRVTNLFVEQAPHLGESHISLFDEIILRMARSLEFRARVALSEQLADVAKAPLNTLRDLALDDDIGVAKPVLERSPRLTEGDLVEVAERKGQDHLLALSVRPVLTPRVTDVLVERGDEAVVRSVAGNEGAAFSDRGYDRIVDRSQLDPELKAALSGRGDIPPRHVAAMLEAARQRVRDILAAELGGRLGDTLQRTLAAVDVTPPERNRSLMLGPAREEARRVVDRAASERPVGEEQVAQWLKGGDIGAALTALADLAAVPVDTALRAYHAPSYDPLLFLVRSLRFGWSTFKLFLTAKAGRIPPADLLRRAFDGFEAVSVATAKRVVRFTTLRDRAAAGGSPR